MHKNVYPLKVCLLGMVLFLFNQPLFSSWPEGQLTDIQEDSGSLPGIHIEPGTDVFLDENGEVFIPWGYQYDHPETIGMIEDNWDLESTWEIIEEDFEEMKRYSANIIRIHLQYNKFMLDPETPNPDALDKLRRLVRIAEDKGLYLDITGLGCYRKSDSPLWYDELSEQDRWASQASFWKAIVATVKDSPAVFAYCLMNEPMVPGKVQTEWLNPYTLEGYSFVQFLVKDRGSRTREEVMQSWISQMANAIREEDPKHFITVGYMSAYFPSVIDAEELDYISIHIYPRTGRIQEYVDYILDSKKNKPLVLEEFSPWQCDFDEISLFMDKTRDSVNGIISYYDGKTLEEKEASGTLVDALGKYWIEMFMEKKGYLSSENNQNQAGVQWKVTELSFTSSKSYQNSFNDVDLDVVFRHADGTSINVPAFWNGGDSWVVRFAPPLPGVWTYTTECTDESNVGLHKWIGTINCTAYEGDQEIYKHGFVRTTPSRRYFTYNDSTPFFYLGDTHWNFPSNTLENFKAIIDKRVEQGFTVIQSEPIGAWYNLADGFTAIDLLGFSQMDERFEYVADQGLVHANAQLFFVAELGKKRAEYPDAYLEKLCRYWVARYSAYPVMWTTAQECDNDYYFERGKQDYYDATSNPWKLVADYIHQYDPYHHPQTGHMENVTATIASGSSFRDLSGHSWFAAQWGPKKNQQLIFNIPKDFWNNGQGKPTVNYEGLYDHLWTNHFGARMQGWTAYLNGMFGHGYGAIDIWLYNSNYDMVNPSIRDGITVTVEDKQTKWDVSMEFPSAYQMGHMHDFFKSIEWWKLIPRFDDPEWFSNEGSWYSLASISKDLYVAYFYNNINRNTGTLNGLDDQSAYRAQWFNPRNGEYTLLSSSVLSSAGSWTIPEKPDSLDWVLLVTNDGVGLSEKSLGRWRLEENALDEYGNMNGLILGDALFSGTETREGQFSLELDGLDDHLMIPDHAALNDLDSFCVAFWLKFDAIPTDSMILIEKGDALRISLDPGGSISFSMGFENYPLDSSGTSVKASDPLETDTWYHLAAGYDGDSLYIYANGERVGASAGVLSGNVLTNKQNLMIGASATDAWERFSGQVDDLILFREMPGPGEISVLYSHYVPTARITAINSPTDFDGDGIERIVLDGTGSNDFDGSIVSYEWHDGTAELGTGEIVDAEFLLGRHMVYLTITDNNAITSTDSVEIEVAGPSFSRWSLEENVRDSNGKNHGTLYGNPAFVSEEVMEDGFALSFDGIDDYLSIYDNASIEGMERFSFSFWMKAEEIPASSCMVLGKEGAYRVILSSWGALTWVIATENNPWYSTGTVLSGGSWIKKDEWNHVVVGYDGSSTYLYRNGELVIKSGGNFAGRIVNNSNQLTFAKGNNSNVGNFKGTLDDVRYFKHMLSDSSVSRLYKLYPIVDTTSSKPVDTTTSVYGISEQLNEVVVFPNPAINQVVLKNLPPDSKVSLYAVTGREFHSEVAECEEISLNVRQCPQGLYILKFGHKEASVFRKILIAR